MTRQMTEQMKPAAQVGSLVALILFKTRVFATSALFPDFGYEFLPLIMLYSQSGEASRSEAGLVGCWQVLTMGKLAGGSIELDETTLGRH
jgi:hypothetical protein